MPCTQNPPQQQQEPVPLPDRITNICGRNSPPRCQWPCFHWPMRQSWARRARQRQRLPCIMDCSRCQAQLRHAKRLFQSWLAPFFSSFTNPGTLLPCWGTLESILYRVIYSRKDEKFLNTDQQAIIFPDTPSLVEKCSKSRPQSPWFPRPH